MLRKDGTLQQRSDDPNEAVLRTLECTNQLLDSLQDDILTLVTEAYYRGAPWSEIAFRLGKSKQTVHERFSRRVHSQKTHELLRRDLAAARRRAREIQLHATEQDAPAVAAFLREQRQYAAHEL